MMLFRQGNRNKSMTILKANKVNLFVSSVLFVFWYHSPNFLDTPHTLTTAAVTRKEKVVYRLASMTQTCLARFFMESI
jgi:hypothetical protein